MYCKNCGYIMDDGTPVCPVCGMKINAGQNQKSFIDENLSQNGKQPGNWGQMQQKPNEQQYQNGALQDRGNRSDNQSLLKKMAIVASVIVLVGLIACVLVDHFVGGRDISKSAEKPVKSVQKTENQESGADGAYDMQDADLGDDLDD